MSENSKIEWTDHTFNPWIGCAEISPGCANCYAAAQDKFRRWTHEGWGGPRRRTSAANWAMPMRWNAQAEAFRAQHGRRQRVFCASLADVFDNAVDPQWRVDLFRLIEATPNLDWLLLTKRIGNVAKMVPPAWLLPGGWPAHVRIGATICDQPEAVRDIPKLLRLGCPNFLSMEPLLGPVDLRVIDVDGHSEIYPLRGTTGCEDDDGNPQPDLPRIDWVIAGGESGSGARPMHADWARGLRDQCATAGVPFLFKQWGEWCTHDQHPDKTGDAMYSDDLSTQRFKSTAIDAHGTTSDRADELDQATATQVFRCGKKSAGRLLDGREWNEVPS